MIVSSEGKIESCQRCDDLGAGLPPQNDRPGRRIHDPSLGAGVDLFLLVDMDQLIRSTLHSLCITRASLVEGDDRFAKMLAGMGSPSGTLSDLPAETTGTR